jgi:hypothetical protein
MGVISAPGGVQHLLADPENPNDLPKTEKALFVLERGEENLANKPPEVNLAPPVEKVRFARHKGEQVPKLRKPPRCREDTQ